jgi:RNA polymerase sigma factor (sigma-70 family)
MCKEGLEDVALGSQEMERELNKRPARSEEREREIERLVKQAMIGDDEALGVLCEKVTKHVLFLASHILRDRDDAEDVSQSALLVVCEKIGKLRAPEAFWAWLSKIVSNEARMYIRRNANHGAVLNVDDYLESLVEKDETHMPQEYTENEETRRVVLRVIDTLPPRQREAIMLFYYSGLTVGEIAKAMNIKQQNASQYLAIARERLKREFEEQDPGTQRSR